MYCPLSNVHIPSPSYPKARTVALLHEPTLSVWLIQTPQPPILPEQNGAKDRHHYNQSLSFVLVQPLLGELSNR